MSNLPDYGIDAPTVVRNNAVGGILAWVASLGIFILFGRNNSDFAHGILVNGGIIGTLLIAVAAFMFWSSKVGKFRIRDKLLNSISWRGDEQVLDIGCGRGLALIAAAQRLNTGHATGSTYGLPRTFRAILCRLLLRTRWQKKSRTRSPSRPETLAHFPSRTTHLTSSFP